VVIGGAARVPAQLQQHRGRGRDGGGGGGGSTGNLQEALQASVESAQVEHAVRASQQQAPVQASASGQQQQQQQREQPPVLSEADFPAVSGGSGSAAGGGGGRWAGAAGSVGGAGGLAADHFPALPGTTKSAKKRAAKKKSMASVLGGDGEVRLLNTAAGGRPPLPPGDHFPALLPHSGSALQLARPAPAAAAEESSSGSSSAAGSRPGSAAGFVQLQRDDWGSVLPRASSRKEQGGLPRPPSVQEIAAPSPEVQEQEERLQARRARRQQQQVQQPLPTAAAATTPLPAALPPSAGAAAAAVSAAAAVPAAAGPSGISEALRAANLALINKIRSQLDAAQFAQFRCAVVEGSLAGGYVAGGTRLGVCCGGIQCAAMLHNTRGPCL
jgi:hypothetical protein